MITTPSPAIDPLDHIRTVVQRLTIGQARRWLPMPVLWSAVAIAGTTLPAFGLALDARPLHLGLLASGAVVTVLLLMLSLRPDTDLAGCLIGAPLVPRWCRPLAFLACMPIPHLPWMLVLCCLLDGHHGPGILPFAVLSAVYHAWRWGYLAIPGEWVLVAAALTVALLESLGMPMRLTGTLIIAGASVVHLLLADRQYRRIAAPLPDLAAA